MSDQWFYRVYGQEFGPVALELVRSLVASGTIAPDDEVRDATRSNWILACAATELRDSIKSPISELTVERREARDEWFCRGATGELGPLKLIDLIQLAAEGELSPDEEIKAKADDYWRQVSSIQRLVDLLPFPEDYFALPRKRSTSFDRDIDDEPQVILFPGARSSGSTSEPGNAPTENSIDDETQTSGRLEANERHVPASDATPAGQATFGALTVTHRQVLSTSTELSCAVSTTDSFSTREDPETTDSIRMWGHQDSEPKSGDSQWTGWIDGKEFGPVEYPELLTWAVTGRLSPTDFIRRGHEGQFVPAVNIPCLFTVRAAANSLSRPTIPIAKSKAVPSTNFDRIVVSSSNRETNEPAGLARPTEIVTRRDTKSFLKDVATDPTSVGVSAMLTIGLMILGWVAFQ